MVFEAVIFDLDGTLVDSAKVSADILNDMRVARGGEADLELTEMRKYVSIGGVDMVRALLGDYAADGKSDIEEFRARYFDIKTAEETLYGGVKETLVALHNRRVRLAICSNKPQKLCRKVLAELNLDGFFEVVVGGGVYPYSKPDARLLSAVMKQLGVNREHVLYVGDSEVDCQLAKNAEVPFVCVSYGYGSAHAMPSDVVYVDEFPSILDMACA